MIRSLAVLLVSAFLGLTAGLESLTAQDASGVAKRAFTSTVYIETRDSQGALFASGSGFFARPNLIITNLHVIKGAYRVTVNLIGKSDKFNVDGVAAFDEDNDLAILRVAGLQGEPLTIESTPPIAGQEIFAIGNPKGLEGTISPGIVSGYSMREFGKSRLLQISAPISPGSSGGPVVNRSGRVVGVAVGSIGGGQNLNFAVPVSSIETLIATVKGTKVLAFDEFARRPRTREDVLSEIAPDANWLVKNLQNSVITSDTSGDPPAANLNYVSNFEINVCALSFETGTSSYDKFGINPGIRGYIDGFDLQDLANSKITTWRIKSEFSKTGIAVEIELENLHRVNYTPLPTALAPNPKPFSCPKCTKIGFFFDNESDARRALATITRVSQLCKVYKP